MLSWIRWWLEYNPPHYLQPSLPSGEGWAMGTLVSMPAADGPEPRSQDSSALNSGINHSVTPANQELGKKFLLEDVPCDRSNAIN